MGAEKDMFLGALDVSEKEHEEQGGAARNHGEGQGGWRWGDSLRYHDSRRGVGGDEQGNRRIIAA